MNQVESLFWPQFLERGERIMAGIKKSALPVLRFGRGSTEASVSISENGQVRFNKLAQEFAGDRVKVVIANFEPKSRVMLLAAVSAPPKGWTEEDCFTLNKGKKGGGSYISCAGVFRMDEVGYDFKASGNQTFKPTLDATKHTISFEVPKGALKAKPKQVRTKKAAKAATEVPKAVAAAASGEDEIVIE